MSEGGGNDAVWRKLYQRARDVALLKAHVGVLASKGGNNRHADSNLTLIEIMAVHEFGSPAAGIPERAPIRKTFYERVPRMLQVVVAKITKAIFADAITARQGVGMLGAWGAAEVKNTITQTDLPPPLTLETVARKGSSKPLVDTAQLLNSITWEVVDEGKE